MMTPWICLLTAWTIKPDCHDNHINLGYHDDFMIITLIIIITGVDDDDALDMFP